jgi:hypothetical protein
VSEKTAGEITTVFGSGTSDVQELWLTLGIRDPGVALYAGPTLGKESETSRIREPGRDATMQISPPPT